MSIHRGSDRLRIALLNAAFAVHMLKGCLLCKECNVRGVLASMSVNRECIVTAFVYRVICRVHSNAGELVDHW